MSNLTKREQIAAMAMQSLIPIICTDQQTFAKDIARLSLEITDELIKQLDKK